MSDMGIFGHVVPGFGWIFMLLFWALIILVIVTLVKWISTSTNSNTHQGQKSKTALEILMERYARGEIEQEEFEQKKQDLES